MSFQIDAASKWRSIVDQPVEKEDDMDVDDEEEKNNDDDYDPELEKYRKKAISSLQASNFGVC
jgi:hypothetical protein